MAFSLVALFYVMVLFTNAVCILSEDRFLLRVGWSTQSLAGFAPNQQEDSVKARLLTLIHAIRTLLRLPLILCNVLIILYELIAG